MRNYGNLIDSRMAGQAETIRMVRENRECEKQNLGFSARLFVLCGLPVKRPRAGCLLHERRNGQFVLQVTGHPSYGLPWGQDRLVPIFLATMAFASGLRESPSTVQQQCWTPSGCSREALNIAGSWPSKGFSAQPSF